MHLEELASAVNADAFVEAYNSDLDDDATNGIAFDFAKYGSVVASVLDWYYGKDKKEVAEDDSIDGFIAITPETEKFGKFSYTVVLTPDDPETPEVDETVKTTYDKKTTVKALIEAKDANILALFNEVFATKKGEAQVDAAAFGAMNTAYANLLAKKDWADKINEKIEEALEMGATLKVLAKFADLFEGNYEDFVDADDEDMSKYFPSSSSAELNKWATGVIALGDENFEGMIDWDSLGAIYANYKESLKTVIADASEIALAYIAWTDKTTVNEDGAIVFSYKEPGAEKAENFTFSDLEKIKIDVYSYDMIKKITELEKTLEDLFDAENSKVVDTLKKLTADVADDEDSLDIALSSVIDYCTDMIHEFHANVMAKVAAKANAIYADYPLFAGRHGKYSAVNEWRYTATWDHDGDDETAKVSVVPMNPNELAIATISTEDGDIKAKIVDAIDKFFTDNNYGTTGSLKTYGSKGEISYQGAIAAVDVDTFVVLSSDGKKFSSFDKAGYKKALDAKIAEVYKSFVLEYVKDPSKDVNDRISGLIKDLADFVLGYGIWSIAGDVVIDGETYTYVLDSNGKARQFNYYDSSEEKVTAGIKITFEGAVYTVSLEPVVDDGVVVITPKLDKAFPNSFDDIYDFLELDVEDLTYDIRDYADEIGANFAKFNAVKTIGTGSAYATMKTDDIKDIFKHEAANDFYTEFEVLRNRMYVKTSATNSNWKKLGDYIDSSVKYSTDVKDSITILSKLARDAVYAMTPETNTIADIEKEFGKYATKVKAVLAEAGLVEGKDYYVNTVIKTTVDVLGDNPATTEVVETDFVVDTVDVYTDVPEYISATKVERPAE